MCVVPACVTQPAVVLLKWAWHLEKQGQNPIFLGQ